MNNRKVLIIGIDGATFDVLNPLMKEGGLPNLKELIKKGASGPLESTFPPISGPAWLSLATGLQPTKTMVYDFTFPKDFNSYELLGMSSSHFVGRAVWDYLSKSGKMVGILNYPMCYPPYRVNGFMTAGLGSSPESNFTYPVELKEELNRVVGDEYELTVSYHDERYEDTELFLKDLQRVLAKKVKAAKYLIKEKEWDFFWVVFSETDWLQHIMWHHIDKNHPLNKHSRSTSLYLKFKEIWNLIDHAVGEICQIVGEQTNIIVHSDHGFGSNDQVFKLNCWLAQEGYLVWRKDQTSTWFKTKKNVFRLAKISAKFIRLNKLAPNLYDFAQSTKDMFIGHKSVIEQIDLNLSKAFDPGHSIPFGGIYINSRLIDSPEKRKALIEEISNKLRCWCDLNNIKVEILQKSDSEVNKGPDLIIGLNDWRCIQLKENLSGKVLEYRSYSSRHTGSHRMNGIFIAAGSDIQNRKLDKISCSDLAPTILYLFNQPIPYGMDGHILKKLFSQDYLKKHPFLIQTEKASSKDMQKQVDNNLTTADEETLRKQLKDLGYL